MMPRGVLLCRHLHVGLLAVHRHKACVYSRQNDDAPRRLQRPQPRGIKNFLLLHGSGHKRLACRAARQARDLEQQKTAVERMLEREVCST